MLTAVTGPKPELVFKSEDFSGRVADWHQHRAPCIQRSERTGDTSPGNRGGSFLSSPAFSESGFVAHFWGDSHQAPAVAREIFLAVGCPEFLLFHVVIRVG